MPVLFVSHANKDDAIADDLGGWLKANGFSDVFIDQKSIAAGAKWDEALQRAAGACRVVLLLVTSHWLASAECYGEFKAAWLMGKRILPLFLKVAGQELGAEEAKRLQSVRREDQGIDITGCLERSAHLNLNAVPNIADNLKAGLRAAGAMSRVGLDPEVFAIDKALRPTPFPGLASFGDEDADAALFYGRSREIAQTLEELRAIRAVRDLRPFVILGASGAGKSSLLKAGIIPRLRRESRAWLPLRAFRPGGDPLLNFSEAMAKTLSDFSEREASGVIRDRLFEVWERAARDGQSGLAEAGLVALEAALETEAARLRKAAARAAATILISVDQAEEIARADGKSAEALADYLRVALASTKSPWQLAFTIRTDSFPELQSHRRFQDLEARGYDLRAIPVFRLDSVVEEPAKRYGVVVDDALVDALMEDAPKDDALPLLAFALQRLWQRYATSGRLTQAHYDKVGGLQGLIEDAAERAMRGFEPEQDIPLPSAPPPARQTKLAAATFVPALVEINDQGARIRHVAEWSRFSEEQQELLKHFDRWRLVVHKGEADGGTVEVAHEALFRTWRRLQSWLEPERARLEALRALQVDAGNWERNGRKEGFLNHRDERLAEARELSINTGYAARLNERDFDYLTACEDAERTARVRARRVQASVGTLVLLLAVAGMSWWKQAWLWEQYWWHFVMGPSALSSETERALQPYAKFSECANGCPKMIVLPPGEFLMGSPETERDRNKDEVQHKVRIGKPFAVSECDVTFAEWDMCVASGSCGQYKPKVEGWGRGDLPVVNVSWEDAQLYVAWLSRLTGQHYRLLSEAEFEYATRAGTKTPFWWGTSITPEQANYDGRVEYEGGGMKGELRAKTVPVKSFKANPWGLYQVHGNVFKWVEDCYGAYSDAPTDGSARTSRTAEDCHSRVLRGGSYYSFPQDLRAAFRYSNLPSYRQPNVGFRVARTLNP
jgi:formylglycine-generating enzyme required for sulfatase activity